MTYVNYITPAIKKAKEAINLDNHKKYEEAVTIYLKASEMFMVASKHELKSSRKNILKERAESLFSRGNLIKDFLKNNDNVPSRSNSGSLQMSKDSKKTNDEKMEIDSVVLSSIIFEKPNVAWDDVSGLENAKDVLKESMILPLKFPQLFKETKKGGVLLYGPSGTGKTHLAKAVAKESDSTFFPISLHSKFVGKPEKLVKTYFALAKKHKPSVIFIDEVESLCCTFGETSNRLKTQLLIEINRIGGVKDGVLILAATNLPLDLDIVVRRIFEKRIYIPLPDQSARMTLLRLLIGKLKLYFTDDNFKFLAEKLEGYSGADINIFVKHAILKPVRRCRHSTHWKKVRGPYPKDKSKITDGYIPCSPEDKDAMELSFNQVKYKLITPPVTFNDFVSSLENVKPSISKKDLKQYEDFTKEFGGILG